MPNGEFRSLMKMLLRLGNAVAVGIAQQRDAVGARNACARPALRQPVDEALDADAALLRRRVALGDQHVAVRQHIDRARMVEPGREGCDRHAVGGGRLGAVGPAVDRSDIDRRDPRMFRRRQGGRRTIALCRGRGFGRRGLGVVAGGKRQRQCGDADGQEDVLAHGRSLGYLALTMRCRPERSCGRHEFPVKRSEGRRGLMWRVSRRKWRSPPAIPQAPIAPRARGITPRHARKSRVAAPSPRAGSRNVRSRRCRNSRRRGRTPASAAGGAGEERAA